MQMLTAAPIEIGDEPLAALQQSFNFKGLECRRGWNHHHSRCGDSSGAPHLLTK
jgi:hypothetical protein